MFKKIEPVYLKNRISYIFLSYGEIDVQNGAFVFNQKDKKVQIPIGIISVIIIEPGCSITHRAVELAANVNTLLIFSSENLTRIYSFGIYQLKNELLQADLYLNNRLDIVRRMYHIRYREEPPLKRSIEQLMGIEGNRVKLIYKKLSEEYGIKWEGRSYERKDLSSQNRVNTCITAGNQALYSITEAAILTLGYSPSIGFIHQNFGISFVCDIADIVKFETVVPLAFKIASNKNISDLELKKEMRRQSRDLFKQIKIFEKIIEIIEVIFDDSISIK